MPPVDVFAGIGGGAGAGGIRAAGVVASAVGMPQHTPTGEAGHSNLSKVLGWE